MARKFATAEESATEDEASTKTSSSDSEDEVTVRDDEISWKVKRGSISLPSTKDNLNIGDISGIPSTSGVPDVQMIEKSI